MDRGLNLNRFKGKAMKKTALLLTAIFCTAAFAHGGGAETPEPALHGAVAQEAGVPAVDVETHEAGVSAVDGETQEAAAHEAAVPAEDGETSETLAHGPGESEEPAQEAEPEEMVAKVTETYLYSGDFTIRQISDVIYMNSLLPGLGSLVIQQDYAGASVIFGGAALGMLILGTVDTNFAWSGYTVLSITYIYNVLRPMFYRRPLPKKTASGAPAHGLNFAVLPGLGGSISTFAVYKAGF